MHTLFFCFLTLANIISYFGPGDIPRTWIFSHQYFFSLPMNYGSHVRVFSLPSDPVWKSSKTQKHSCDTPQPAGSNKILRNSTYREFHQTLPNNN